MENPTEPCTNNTMSENDKSDATVLENMEEKNHGDETEMKALEKNNTWEICALPKGHKPVGCKWVLTLKYKADGTLDRHKARLVAKGFTQTYGLDVKNAFMNGDLVEEVYMGPPPGFEAQFGQQVCKLQKSLYGLKQSPRAWFDKFTTFVKSQEYSQGHSDHTLFTKVAETGKIAILIVYVDDIVLSRDDQA
ncbi:Cysteine-rich RLK (receptor-like protein kinase) 8 [Cucumis melo var. makuwa]|uniref:Cysteine-rich RLK (Receptor-like protein kinase) 8 n=1 Tax=Cucumis melo var. makuwa TaxID=1194695 RepID=A0A5D3CH62_CUCMM|nr:Cysteine-rich RLK (receptor-like protein kinase) 8 [Cucumis melo var. makuwa]TYK09726.1 Cysteine-rich RLK (receptor-like protein kinase) 8 [Cucumis melo var. makuwa]